MTRKGRRLVVLLAGLVVVVGAGAAVALAANRSAAGASDGTVTAPTTTVAGTTTPEAVPSTTPTETPSPTVTAASRTEQSTAPAATSTASQPVAGRTVQVALGYADWDATGSQVEAAGFVPGVVQSGGVCTLSLSRAGTTVTATNTGQADATTTNCGALTIPGAQLSPGTWQATLSYRSDTAHGTSAPLSVTVPAR